MTTICLYLTIALSVASTAAYATSAPEIIYETDRYCKGTVTDTSDFPLLVSTLDRTVSDSINFGYVKTLPMKYGIFDGTSSLRSLVDNDIIDLLKQQKSYYHRIAAILLLFRGNLEASHEVVLGVSLAEIEEAEYAASHPGETSWSEDHPLTTASDMIHSIIHRLEGPALGEGNHTGYENAKYWAMGGPKKMDKQPYHHVRQLLAERARLYAPCCVARGVVVRAVDSTSEDKIHCIIAGGEQTRNVQISPGEWNSIAFIDICKLRSEGRLTEEECAEVADLQRAEMLYLLRDELEQVTNSRQKP